jgi:lipoprotein-anchoring transpeptidase ErfK/SrfK
MPAATAQSSSRTMASRPVARPVVRIVVSIPDRKLALVEDDRVVKIYPVAVGATATPSPEGEFRIATRLENPSWYWPGKVIPAGTRNPLGPRWMGLGVRGFGIHGTNEPRTIGRSASHGCIRMRNRDVKDLFRRVRAGDVVEIYGKRDATLAAIFGAPQDDAGARATFRTARASQALEAVFTSADASSMVRE